MPRDVPLQSLALLLALGACSGSTAAGAGNAVSAGITNLAPAASVPQPAGWADDLALRVPTDLNPDPDILEINLEARITEMEIVPGHKTPVWSYDGGLPGPLIRGKVGDRVIVHFRNSLPDSTTIHWHGMRVPNHVDGAPGATQPPIAPGAEFTYDFVLADAGTYWYHPHLDSAAQVNWGLYGPIVVDDPAEAGMFGDELVLMLSDMSIDETGAFTPSRTGGAFGDLFGREGEVLLVNGKVVPELLVRQGKPQRWRIINAARSRYYSFRFSPGVITRIGGDGGLIERPEPANLIKLVPGERTDVVFTPQGNPGTEMTLLWQPTDRGYGSTFNRPLEPVMTIRTVSDAPVAPARLPPELRDVEAIDTVGATRQFIDMTIISVEDDAVSMGINGIDGRHHDHEQVILEARVGETQIWEVRNDTDFAHPFHLHGFFFQVLDPADPSPEWKDTVDLPAKSSLRLAVYFDNRPGLWMIHCHILDHAELGMMGLLRVLP